MRIVVSPPKPNFFLVPLTFLMIVPSVAQTSIPDAGRARPAPGTSIRRFAQIDEGVYKGSKPKNDADFRFLQSKHVTYILDLKFFPLLYRLEKNKAKRYGMTVIPATINASPIAPSEKHVNHILCILADKRLRPIYLHCSVGRDRTSLIATLYEINFRGLPPNDAWETMNHFGFKDGWTLRGLRVYLQDHSDPSKAPLNCSSN
jgi:protein-tyrosine phosphatase family protein